MGCRLCLAVFLHVPTPSIPWSDSTPTSQTKIWHCRHCCPISDRLLTVPKLKSSQPADLPRTPPPTRPTFEQAVEVPEEQCRRPCHPAHDLRGRIPLVIVASVGEAHKHPIRINSIPNTVHKSRVPYTVLYNSFVRLWRCYRHLGSRLD
ncbi:uncharacterized protein BDZ83DRAFT_243726 [Colletotrichum acutatum]|uniref:Secreted protein n=1 Tax=Glomerella acutata TaxID=27357 RepID=A0AAD8XPK5_GLOAC|nr:uncharacterized protein BDZ83DRAFT_243726 [Colletotrichum acutatum]KAK1731248.1 hypothetical protein BDZ83DRAFT_243726 [Colletotrichum acutatum]